MTQGMHIPGEKCVEEFLLSSGLPPLSMLMRPAGYVRSFRKYFIVDMNDSNHIQIVKELPHTIKDDWQEVSHREAKKWNMGETSVDKE